MGNEERERSYSVTRIRQVLRGYFAPRVADQVLRELEGEKEPTPPSPVVAPPTDADRAKARARLRRAGVLR